MPMYGVEQPFLYATESKSAKIGKLALGNIPAVDNTLP
jgi:hypothetical protein